MANSRQNPSLVPMNEAEIRPKELEARQEALFLRDVAKSISRYDEFVSVTCPACSSDEFSFRFFKVVFRFVECNRCQTLFMTPRPSKSLMRDYYENSENYRFWATGIFPSSESSRREKIAQPSLERILDICRQRGIERRLLVEVGPGFGTFLSLVNKSGEFTSALGIEPTPELADACRSRGLEVLEKPIEEIEPEQFDKADVLVAFEVIEHLFSPREFLTSARKLLSDSGVLVLSFPSSAGFDISLLGANSSAVDLEHVNLFNPYSIDILLGQTGFRVLDCFSPGRLDVELVRKVGGSLDLDFGNFLNRIVYSTDLTVRENFQRFLAENCLSSHLWVVATPSYD